MIITATTITVLNRKEPQTLDDYLTQYDELRIMLAELGVHRSALVR